jgi:tetratricopeptide (TPR) repeat protein
LKEARSELERAVELDPGYVEAWVNLGGVLMSCWEFDGCVEANQQAADCDPSCMQAHYNQGLGHMYLGQAEEMEACYQKVLQLDPKNPGGHYHLAVARLALGKVPEAKGSLAVAVRLGWAPQPEFLRALEREKTGQVFTMEIEPKEKDDSTDQS